MRMLKSNHQRLTRSGTFMLRLQDILFGIFAVVAMVMLAYDFRIAVFALLSGVVCGAFYLLAGMVPPRSETFWRRLSTSGFLSLVLASLVLIVPGTFGHAPPEWRGTALTIAMFCPLIAISFEVLRTPRLLQTILRALGYR
jgi:hypothetical protein